jgi:hypothetical protein
MQARAAGPSDCSALLADASRVGMIRNTTITSATYVTTVAAARELIRLIC